MLDDGRMNIVVEGGERFRLLELTSGRSFTTGLVEPVVDDDDPPAEADVDRALEVFRELAETSESDVDFPEPDVAAARLRAGGAGRLRRRCEAGSCSQ